MRRDDAATTPALIESDETRIKRGFASVHQKLPCCEPVTSLQGKPHVEVAMYNLYALIARYERQAFLT